jgi:HD-like signal output (HDOD) protein
LPKKVTSSMRALFDQTLRLEYEVFGDRWNRLFQETMVVAFGASQAAFDLGVAHPGQVFLAGRFHDVDKTLALRALAALTVLGRVPADLPAPMAEEVMERVHVPVRFALHRSWGLPARLEEICRDHHLPVPPEGPEHQDLHLLRAVEGIQRLVLDPQDGRRLGETRQSLQALRLERRGARRLHHILAGEAAQVAVLFPG